MESILRQVPLFARLSAHEISFVAEHSRIVNYKKGQIIYNEGSGVDAFYCIAWGRVMIYTWDASGKKNVLEYLHHGKYFGIISLLTNEPHSVTAEAMNDCSLLVIDKNDFDLILARVPAIAVDLSRSLSRRLKRKDIHQKTVFESTIISVFSSYSQAGKTIYALNLAIALAKETQKRVIILDLLPQDKTHSLPKRLDKGPYRILELIQPCFDNPALAADFIIPTLFGVDIICFHYLPDDELSMKRLLGITSLLVNDYHYLLLDLPSVMDRAIFGVLNQSDIVQLLTSPDPVDLKRTHNLAQRLKEEFNFPAGKIKLIINEYKLAGISPQDECKFLGQEVFATLPKIDFSSSDRMIIDNPECEYSRAVRRIARVLGERVVGLVLGVGLAYGFCHIGVLRVIEEEKIPIDIIAGSSIGALIASLWATGRSSQEILEITREFREPKHIWNLVDLTLPRAGFLKGNKLRRFLKKHLGNKTFYDLRLPLKVIASDVKRKEPKILDKGLLVDAIMASCSMPGVFTPFRLHEEMLFDGGVIHPLPTEPLLKLGVNKIIAVNVTPSREDILRQYDKMKLEMGQGVGQDIKKKNWFSLGVRLRSFLKFNILDIIFSSFEILQSEVAQKEAQLADIVLHPETSGLSWLDLHRATEFARRGEEETRKNLEKIWRVIKE